MKHLIRWLTVAALATAGCLISIVSASAFANLQVSSVGGTTLSSTSSTIAQLNFTGATGTNLAITSLTKTWMLYATTSGVIVGDANLTWDSGDAGGFGGTFGINGTASSTVFYTDEGAFGASALGGGSLAQSLPTSDGSQYFIFDTNQYLKIFAVRDDGRVDIGAVANTTTHAQVFFKDYDSVTSVPKVLFNNPVGFSGIGVNQLGDVIVGSVLIDVWGDQWWTFKRSNGDIFPTKNNSQSLGQASSSLANIYASGTILGGSVSSTNASTTNLFATYVTGTKSVFAGLLGWTSATGTNVSSTSVFTSYLGFGNATGTNVSSTAAFHSVAIITNVTSTGLFSTLAGWTNASGTNVSSTALFTSLLAFANASGSTGVQTNVSSTSLASSFASFAKATATLLMVGDGNPIAGIGILTDNNNMWDIGTQGAAFRNIYASGTIVGVNVTSTDVTSTNISASNALYVSYGTSNSNIVTSNKVCTYLNMNVGTNSSTLINSLIGPTSNFSVQGFGATSTPEINTTSTGVVRIRPLGSGAVVNAGSTYEVNICVWNGIQ